MSHQALKTLQKMAEKNHDLQNQIQYDFYLKYNLNQVWEMQSNETRNSFDLPMTDNLFYLYSEKPEIINQELCEFQIH